MQLLEPRPLIEALTLCKSCRWIKSHTHTQGELINIIERNVENATVYTYQAQKEVKKAVVFKRKNRKVRSCVLTSMVTLHFRGYCIVGNILGLKFNFLTVKGNQ